MSKREEDEYINLGGLMKPVAYIYPSDLERIASHPMTCTAYPEQVRCAEECTIPLFTLAQVREYAEARSAALLEELADKEQA